MRCSPLNIRQLEGQRVALWGWGREGKAAYGALRRRGWGWGLGAGGLSENGSAQTNVSMPLTLFCSVNEAEDARALGDPLLAIDTEATAERLAAFDVVIKSPGISAYRPELLAAAERGTRFVGGTALWFAEHPDARTICVTGTKGKSTTTALLAHLLRAGGHRTALCGNIGMPLLELLDPPQPPEFWAIEVSSYQTRDVAASGVHPEVAVATNIFPEHLDWHGSERRYIEDKLALFTEARPRIAVLNRNDPTLAALSVGARHARDAFEEAQEDAKIACMARSYKPEVRWYGTDDGWHLRGDAVYRGDRFVFDTARVPLPGRHNRGNLCAVLAAIEALGLDAAALAKHAVTFQPLPHRLQTPGKRDGIVYVNDSISTTPHATLAALDVFRGRRVALLIGGHDRGVDWSAFAEAMRTQAPAAIATLGQNGPRIHALLAPVAATGAFSLQQTQDLGDAVAKARAALRGEGVVLLSPGAPSFGSYRDYTERGRHFASLAGFDAEAIASIPGLGIV